MLTFPPSNALDQGVIFTCATAEDYSSCSVHGLVITARCDITNDKVQTYSYVPVVSFDDWLWRDGARIVSERTKKSATETMETALANCGFAASILSTRIPDEILAVLFPPDAPDKTIKSGRKTFEKAALRMKLAEAFLESATKENAQLLIASEQAPAKALAKELCQNAIAEAYYLPGVYPQERSMGYVALLREISHIPRALATGLIEGLDEDSYKTLCEAHPRCKSHLTFEQGDFAYPIGLLQSPFMEHLMQRLTSLFSRIGVTDITEEVVNAMQAHISNIKES